MAVLGFWTNAFRFGLYDLLTPINYDASLQEAWTALAPAATDCVLDAGCGSGRLLLQARPWLAAGGHMTAVDLDAAGLRYAARRARRLRIAQQLTFRSGDLCGLSEMNLPPFDGVVAHFSVYVLPTDADRRLAVRQLAAVLRPGGRCVLAVPSEHYQVDAILSDACKMEHDRRDLPWWRRTLRRRVLYRLTKRGLDRIASALDQDLFHRYIVAELEAHCAEAGLTDFRIATTYGGCGYRVVAQRALD